MEAKKVLIIFLLIPLFVFAAEKEKNEIVFVISGSHKFGGRRGRPYQSQIGFIIENIANQIQGEVQFAAVWTNPAKHKFSPITIYGRTSDKRKFLETVNNYLVYSKEDKSDLDIMGIIGATQWALSNKMFSKYANTYRVLFVIIHKDIPKKEWETFLHQNRCEKVLIYFLIFAEPNTIDCDNDPEFQELLDQLNKELNWHKYFKHETAICGSNLEEIGKISQYLEESLPIHKTVTKHCVVPTTLKPPVKDDDCEGEDCESANTKATPCQDLTCKPWLIALIGFIAIGIVVTAIIVIYNIVEQYLNKPKPQYSLASALAKHHNMMMGGNNTMYDREAAAKRVSVQRSEENDQSKYKGSLFSRNANFSDTEDEGKMMRGALRKSNSEMKVQAGKRQSTDDSTPTSTPLNRMAKLKRRATAPNRKGKRRHTLHSGALHAMMEQSIGLAGGLATGDDVHGMRSELHTHQGRKSSTSNRQQRKHSKLSAAKY